MSVFSHFLIQDLGWYLCPETAISWLTLYFQLASMKKQSDVLEPLFPRDTFLQMTRVGFHLTIKVHNQKKSQGWVLNRSTTSHRTWQRRSQLVKLLNCQFKPRQHFGTSFCSFSCGLVHDLQCFCFSSQLLDLCVLHTQSLDFQYNVLAASVLSHFVQQETVEKVSGKIFYLFIFNVSIL